MSVIKQISVFNGSDWSTGDIGADAKYIDIDSAILGSSTNVQSALTTIGNKIGTTAIPSGLGTTLTGAINTLNTNLDGLVLYKNYSYTIPTIGANAVLWISNTNLNRTTPSGYQPLSIYRFTCNNNLHLVTIDLPGTNPISVKNLSNTALTNVQINLGLLYIKSMFEKSVD